MPAIVKCSCVAFIIAIIASAAACGNRHTTGDTSLDTSTPDSDAGDDGMVDSDLDVEAGDVDPMEDESLEEVVDPVLPPLEELPSCGNRVLDGDEECDDGNRLNGDGCDWSCHLGDGDPPPDPDPDVTDYAPSGDPAPLPGAAAGPWYIERLPLVWTGAEYASVWELQSEPPAPPEFEFRRFGIDGATIDAPWRYSAPPYSGGLELVWNGSGFGLFFVDREVGLYYMRLDAAGKPLGSPVLVEDDPRVRGTAADLASGGYVVSWVSDTATDPSTHWSMCNGDGVDILRVRLVDPNGLAIGPVVTVDETAQGAPDVATGDGGFGLVFPVNDIFGLDASFCALRFVRLDASLSEAASSGVLGRTSLFGDVAWADGHWATAWSTCHPCTTLEYVSSIAVARFSPDGILVGPPVLNAPYADDNRTIMRLAAGDGGMVLVWTILGGRLEYLRTDSTGIAVGPVHYVVSHEDYSFFGPFGIAWSGGAFGVLYQQIDPEPEGLYLRHFVSAE